MRKIQFAVGKYYHLYNRGVDKRSVFISKEDYDRFEAYLYLLNDVDAARAANFFGKKNHNSLFENKRSGQLVAIGAYCIMPNHFHILATPAMKDGIQKFMQKLLTAYTMYFNVKYRRTGSLFEGTYRAQHAETEKHLKYLLGYIHLNPAKLFSENWKQQNILELQSLAKAVMDYRYSSINEYCLSTPLITDPSNFPRYFTLAKNMDVYIRYWLDNKDKYLANDQR